MAVELAQETQLVRGFFLGDWEIRPLAGIVAREGVEKHLEPKVMDVLVCLARHQGEVVTRDMLLDEVWGKVIVSDDAITRCISELRAVLGDTDRERIYIRTISRRGYSLLLPVTPKEHNVPSRDTHGLKVIDGALSQKSTDQEEERTEVESNSGTPVLRWIYAVTTVVVLVGIAWLLLSAQQQQPVQFPVASGTPAQQQTVAVQGTTAVTNPDPTLIRSLAVLPFVNLSGDASDDLFAEGLSEDIRNTLMGFPDLRIAARTSSTVFKGKAMDVRDIASQLNVDALLEGTVRINNGKLRVTTQLTHGINGYSVWAASYERDMSDKTQLQTEVAQEIARQLGLTLHHENGTIMGHTNNMEAHDLYLLGRHHWHERTPESLQNAEQYFKDALTLDPNFALALSGLADALLFQSDYGDRPSAESEAAAQIAVTTALELEPQLAEAHASLGLLRKHSRDIEGAKQAYEKAIALKPDYSMAQMWLGNAWMDTRHINRAYAHYQTALELDPLHPTVQYNYTNALMGMGKYQKALLALERFASFGQQDHRLKAEIQARLSLGQFDKVLDLAVTHTYTGETKPHTELAVIEALIQLGRMEEAAQMIQDNRDSIDDWPYGWLQASLSVARRDPAGLNTVADYFESPDLKFTGKVTAECAQVMSIYLRGLAASLGGNHAIAEQHFTRFSQLSDETACAIIEPEIKVAALLYQARSRAAMSAEELPAMDSLLQAGVILQQLRELGWDSLTINTIDTGLQLLKGDSKSALSLVSHMEERKWQPYGLMQSSPLFDNFLVENADHPSLIRLRDRYVALKDRCDVIGLAKLGL